MATPISWRDIKAPDNRAANSLISGAFDRFENSFSGIESLGKLASQQSAIREKDVQNAKANAVFGSILNGGNPNDLSNIDFAGLGGQGADVAKFLAGQQNSYYDNQATQARTDGQINLNDAFGTRETAELRNLGARTQNVEADTNISTITGNNLQSKLDTEQKVREEGLRFGKLGNAYKEKEFNANSPFLVSNAQSNNTVNKNKATDSTTFSDQYGTRLEADLAGVNANTGATISNAAATTRNAGTNAFNAQTSRRSQASQAKARAATTKLVNSTSNNVGGVDSKTVSSVMTDTIRALEESPYNSSLMDKRQILTLKMSKEFPNMKPGAVSQYVKGIFSGEGNKPRFTNPIDNPTEYSTINSDEASVIGKNIKNIGRGKIPLSDGTKFDTSKLSAKTASRLKTHIVNAAKDYNVRGGSNLFTPDFTGHGWSKEWAKDLPDSLSKELGLNKSKEKELPKIGSFIPKNLSPQQSKFIQ